VRKWAADFASLIAVGCVLAAGAILWTSSSGVPPVLANASALATAATDRTDATATPPLPNTAGSPAVAPPRALDVAGLHIVVPRLDIDLPLEVGDPVRDVPRPGFSGATPEHVALVFPGSRDPGDGGNTYIYAHARAGMFVSLWNTRIGDVVLIRSDAGTERAYEVALIVPRVDPGDTHWLDASGPERLTLQTSTGPRPEDPRFIAVAYPMSVSTPSPSP
jgi:sortase (surface protein transpeptidase)